MSSLTVAFYVGFVLFVTVMLIGPLARHMRFSRRFRLRCPTDGAETTLWATDWDSGSSGNFWRLDACSKLGPGHACNEACLKELPG